MLDCYDSQVHADGVAFTGVSNASSTVYREIRSSADCSTPWAGKAGTGANFEKSAPNNGCIFYVDEAYCRVLDVAAKAILTINAGPYYCYNLTSNASGAKIINCVAHDAYNSGYSSQKVGGFYCEWSISDPVLFYNCIARDNSGAGFYVRGIQAYDKRGILCCTAFGNGEKGFTNQIWGGVAYIWSCYGADNTGGDFNESGWSSGSGWNASKDTSSDIGGTAGDNYKNSLDLFTSGDLDSDGLATADDLYAAGGAGDNYGRNPYNDLSATVDFNDFLKNDQSGDSISKKDIAGTDRPTADTADVSWNVGASESGVTLQDETMNVSGGAIAGGSGSCVAAATFAVSGGAIAGGEATLSSTGTYSGTGGAIGGGSLTWAAVRSEIASGGAIAGGPDMAIAFSLVLESIGGAVVGGSGELGPRITGRLSTGGGISGGAGDIVRTISKLASGGAIAGGTILPYLITRALQAVGGAVAGGTLGSLGLYKTKIGRPYWEIGLSADPVWAFTEQPNKWGYLNNPRWMSPSGAPVSYDVNPEEEPQIWEPRQLLQSKSDSIKHIPCGHWHKVVPPEPVEDIDIDIYGLFEMGGRRQFWGVNFDGSKLTYMGVYDSGGVSLNGLLIDGDNVATVAGEDADAEIRFIDGQSLSLVSTATPFNAYDVTENSALNVENAFTRYNESGDVYFTCPNGLIIRLSSAYARTSRGNMGTVVTGTDGHLYHWTYVYGGWFGGMPELRPVTGESWDSMWDLIPDDLIDGPVEEWSTELHAWAGPGGQVQVIETDSCLYALSVHSPSSKIYSIHKTNYSKLARTEDFGIIWYIYPFNGSLYLGAGTLWNFTIHKLNGSSLELEAELASVERGRLPKITDAGGYLIVATETYADSTGAVLKLNPDTLEIEGMLSYPDSLSNAQAILKLNERFVCVGYNSGMFVFDVTTMRIVDKLGTPGYVTGYKHKCLVRKDKSIYV